MSLGCRRRGDAVRPSQVVCTYQRKVVYTNGGMDDRPVVWTASSVRHIEGDHPERQITRDEVTEVLNDAERIEAIDRRRDVDYHVVVGRTLRGRTLVVAWVDHPQGRLPVHARQAGRQAARRYYR